MHEVVKREEVEVLPLLELLDHSLGYEFTDVGAHKRPGRDVFSTSHPKALCPCLEDLERELDALGHLASVDRGNRPQFRRGWDGTGRRGDSNGIIEAAYNQPAYF